MRPALPRWIVALVALAAIGAALWQLRAQADGLRVEAGLAGTVPLTVYRPVGDAPAPAIVIAHGFAGSRQLMQPFATSLARRGYVAVVFDFPGHARNPVALPAGLADRPAMQRSLLDALDAVVEHARSLPGANGRVGVLGHSMAADVVVQYGHAHPDVAATVAVSLFVPEPHAWRPRNLLVIDGALEPAMLREHGLATLAATVGGAVEPGTTYGDFADGSARRIVFARGVEHIGVLYSGDSLREAGAWFDQAFGRATSADAPVDTRGPWLGVLFLGMVALAWPLAGMLPRVAAPAPRAPAGWRWLLPVALLPALATPLLLRAVPVSARGRRVQRPVHRLADRRIRVLDGTRALAAAAGGPAGARPAAVVPRRRMADAAAGADARRLCLHQGLLPALAGAGDRARPATPVLPGDPGAGDPAAVRHLRPVQRMGAPAHRPPAAGGDRARAGLRLVHRHDLPGRGLKPPSRRADAGDTRPSRRLAMLAA